MNTKSNTITLSSMNAIRTTSVTGSGSLTQPWKPAKQKSWHQCTKDRISFKKSRTTTSIIQHNVEKDQSKIVHYNRIKPFISRELISEMGGAGQTHSPNAATSVQDTIPPVNTTSEPPVNTTSEPPVNTTNKRTRKTCAPSGDVKSEYHLRSKVGKMWHQILMHQ